MNFECEENICFVTELILLRCEIKNNSASEINLEINLENCEDDEKIAFYWHCDMVFEIGKLAPNNSFFIDLGVVPLQTGLLVR